MMLHFTEMAERIYGSEVLEEMAYNPTNWRLRRSVEDLARFLKTSVFLILFRYP